MTTDCPFCRISEGKLDASLVYEDETVLAFMDLNPITKGHTLVVSRQHYENIYEVPEKTLADMATVTKKISVAVKKAVNADGVKLIQLNGRSAGQVVMHIHIHVIPASVKAGPVRGTHGRITAKRDDLDQTAQKIRENL